MTTLDHCSPFCDSIKTMTSSNASSPVSERCNHTPKLRRAKFDSQYKTIYKKQFTHKAPIANKYYNLNTHNTCMHLTPLQMSSTKQVDYIYKGPITTLSCKEEYQKKDDMFMGKSSYKVNFIDWECSNPRLDKMPTEGVYTLPFTGTSSYQNSFIPMDLRCKSKKFPDLKCHVDSPFDFESTHQCTYKKFNLEKMMNHSPKEEVASRFSFPNQFMSESRRSFSHHKSKPAVSAKRCDHAIF